MAERAFVSIDDLTRVRGDRTSYDPYRALAAAVCFQAFCDLKDRYAGKEYSSGRLPETETLERFFRSDRYQMLSGLNNGEQVIQQAKFRGEYERFRFLNGCRGCRVKPSKCIHKEGKAWDKITEEDIYCKRRALA